MRRFVVLLLSVALVGAGCSNGSTKDAATATSTRATATSTPAVTTADCLGIGTVPNEPQVTVVRRDGLYAIDADGSEPCLVRGERGVAKWAPTGNRVVFDGKVHYASGRDPTPIPASDVTWSRPRGSSFLALDDGCLNKWPAAGGGESSAVFGDCGIDAFAYHPAGKHIAVAAQGPSGHGIYIATNTGEGMRLVSKGESATRITDMAFSQDGERLYFIATHDGATHLHRLDLNTAKIETLASAPTISDLHVSPIGGVAWRTGDCEASYETFVLHKGKSLELPGEVSTAKVVGWMTPDTMVFFTDSSCGTAEEHRVLRWTPGGPVVELAAGAMDADIRTPLPPAPGPPPRKVFDIPESAAPA